VVDISQSTLLKTLLSGVGVVSVKLRAYRDLGHAEAVACESVQSIMALSHATDFLLPPSALSWHGQIVDPLLETDSQRHE
jgi:hypothetical protein